MLNIKKQLNKDLDEAWEDVSFYDARGKNAEARDAARHANDIGLQLDILSDIEREREGNLIRFNEDGTFSLWCIRTPEGGEQIIEYYEAEMSFADYEDTIECANCLDVTDEFDTEEISHLVIVTDDLAKCDRDEGIYYLVSNDTLQNALFECS